MRPSMFMVLLAGVICALVCLALFVAAQGNTSLTPQDHLTVRILGGLAFICLMYMSLASFMRGTHDLPWGVTPLTHYLLHGCQYQLVEGELQFQNGDRLLIFRREVPGEYYVVVRVKASVTVPKGKFKMHKGRLCEI